jgi:glycosyltransferase involved in cell wall biosynthesis
VSQQFSRNIIISGLAMRLAIVVSHPIQYYAPFFRELSGRIDLMVYFAHRVTPADQARAGFGVEFEWDVTILDGYPHVFLSNVANTPRLDRFDGCDTPEISARLAEGRFDAVLVLGWHLKAYLQAIFAAKRLGLALLARGDSQLQTPRSALKRTIKHALYPAFLRLFDCALYVGNRSRAYWRHYQFPNSRLFFSPHCVDNKWFEHHGTAAAGAAFRMKLGLDLRAKVLLFVGKLLPLKRPLDLVHAAALVNEFMGPAAVVVAGSGELKGALDERAKLLKVPVYQLGFCNQSEMPAVYAASDVLVLPSDRETWGLVANEALACGRPIILSDAVGAGPDLIDSYTGRIFPVGNIPALAQAIATVLAGPPSSGGIAAKSRAYSPSAAADGVEQALGALRTGRSAVAVHRSEIDG